MSKEKQKAALSSVVAAIFLTSMKVVVGVFTGSLGIVSEALHSAMDLFAAGITFFAVRFADKPADKEHNYGHGKMESFSALVEVLILWATCIWIIYEAAEKIFFGQSVEISGSYWGIAVLVVAIIIDVSRSRMLSRVAKKHGSQALEADALHFASDVWSSCVVIVGLICVWVGDQWNIQWLKYADPIAALGVAALVIKVSIKLGRETINVLLDAAPKGMHAEILGEARSVNGVIEVRDIRVRPSGALNFIDITVGIDRNENYRAANDITEEVKARIQGRVPKSDVVVSTYPVDKVEDASADIYRTVKKIVDSYPECANIHNIHVYESEGKRRIAAHIELKENLTLKASHELSHRIEKEIDRAFADISGVSITFECADQKASATEMSAGEIEDIKEKIRSLVDGADGKLDCHEIELYKKSEGMSAFLHCATSEDYTVDRLKTLSDSIKLELKKNIGGLKSVHIHFEPFGED
jgi:cation diffusion facilitator family transporter